MITLAEDDGLADFREATAFEIEISDIDPIDDAGYFTSDESTNWAFFMNDKWYVGERPKFDRDGVAVNQPPCATHIMWSEE